MNLTNDKKPTARAAAWAFVIAIPVVAVVAAGVVLREFFWRVVPPETPLPTQIHIEVRNGRLLMWLLFAAGFVCGAVWLLWVRRR
jgi:hypothetical protein